jgi:pyruvate kinase
MYRRTYQALGNLNVGRRFAPFSSKSKSLPMSFQLALNYKTVNPNQLCLTKLTATIGPASEQLPIIHDVVDAGVNIMRINFSHATYEEANLRVTNLNLYRRGFNGLRGKDGINCETNMRAIMLDTQGPEIRTGSFGNNVKEVELIANSQITLTTDESFRTNQTSNKIWISYKSLLKTVQPGNIILLDDGAIQVEILKHISDNEVTGKILNTGTLGNKKGVNMPGLVVDLPALSVKDREDIK